MSEEEFLGPFDEAFRAGNYRAAMIASRRIVRLATLMVVVSIWLGRRDVLVGVRLWWKLLVAYLRIEWQWTRARWARA